MLNSILPIAAGALIREVSGERLSDGATEHRVPFVVQMQWIFELIRGERRRVYDRHRARQVVSNEALAQCLAILRDGIGAIEQDAEQLSFDKTRGTAKWLVSQVITRDGNDERTRAG